MSRRSPLVRAAAARAVKVGDRLVGQAGILAYHRVASTVVDPWRLCVEPQRFERQVSAMSTSGRIERLESVLDTSFTARLRHRSPRFAITFDDGYADNLDAAVPILERHDAPATVFIATGLIDQPSFWWDVLSRTVFDASLGAARIRRAAIEVGILQPDDAAEDLARLHVVLHRTLAARSTDEATDDVRRFAELVGAVPLDPSSRPMTTDEVRRLARHPLISIGAHTLTHPRLSGLSPATVVDEVATGAARLRELCGRDPQVLAYPYGDTDWTVVAAAQRAGFSRAVTTADRWIGSREHPMLVPRLHPPDLDGQQFCDWLRRSPRKSA